MLTIFRHRTTKAPQNELFREDVETGLPKKLTRKEQQKRKKDVEAMEGIEKKREAKPQTGKRTGGKPKPRPARGMTSKHAEQQGTETEV